MVDVNFENNNESLTLIVKNGELPQYLYKYMSIDTAKLILSNGNVKFSNPIDFNDPFDCNITIDTDNSEEEIENYILDLSKKYQLNNKELYQLRDTFLNNDNRFNMTINAIKNAKKEFGITCFSKKYDDLLMWAHYADKHRGVVFKFDILEDTDFFMTPFHVIYSAKYPKYNYIRDKDWLSKLLLETKSSDWKYEKEVRVMKRGVGLYPIRKNALKGLIFGCQVLENQKIELIRLAKEYNWLNTEFLSSQIKQWEFGLNFYKTLT